MYATTRQQIFEKKSFKNLYLETAKLKYMYIYIYTSFSFVILISISNIFSLLYFCLLLADSCV